MTVSLYFACKRAGGAGRLLLATGASSPPPFCFFSPFGLPSAFGVLPSAFGAFFAFSSAMSMFVMGDDIGRRIQFLLCQYITRTLRDTLETYLAASADQLALTNTRPKVRL